MNIEQAKAIPISEILDKLNLKPDRVSGYDLYYKSPWRKEKTASFHVNTKKNVWFDHGDPDCKGGDTVSFVQKWLQYSKTGYSVSDALRWINTMQGYAPVIAPVKSIDPVQDEPVLTITNKQAIKSLALVEYLDSRGIPKSVADKYLQEVNVYNRKNRKSIFALGFKNDNGGHELRNKFFKGSTKPKYITFIRGSVIKPPGIHIFEGWPDYLSAIIHKRDGQRFKNDAIVLNSLSNLQKATPYIKGYGYRYAYTWMDNDQPGKEATANLDAFFKTEESLTHKPQNAIYAPYKDVNAWHMVKCGLTG